jgi:hypothetical protein
MTERTTIDTSRRFDRVDSSRRFETIIETPSTLEQSKLRKKIVLKKTKLI